MYCRLEDKIRNLEIKAEIRRETHLDRKINNPGEIMRELNKTDRQ